MKKGYLFVSLLWVILIIAFLGLGISMALNRAPWPQTVFSFCMVGVVGLRWARSIYRLRRREEERENDENRRFDTGNN